MALEEISDYQAEAGIVATIIYHPDFILQSPNLHEKYFYSTDNACIYWAVSELYKRKITSISALNIEQMINSNTAVRRTMEKYNMPSVQEYIELCAGAKRDTVEEYKLLVNRVITLAFKREFYKKTMSWQNYCLDMDTDLDKLNNKVYKEFNDLTTSFVTDGDVQMFGAKVDGIYGKIKAKKDRGESYGFKSFFEPWNEFFTYEKTELVVISARMKKGKSWLALIEGVHKAANGVPTIIQDSEMSDENFYIRLLSYLSGIKVGRIKNETLSEEEERKILQTNEMIKRLPLYHNFDPYMTQEKFYSICAQKKIEAGLEFVIWDYIKCDDSIRDPAERSAYMGGMTNWLKNVIGGDLGMAGMAFAQLNRNNEVAESDGIEKYCSVSARWEEKTPEEIVRDGAECGTHKFSVKLNRLGEKQHNGGDEYIDMMFSREKVGIVPAKQHIPQGDPFG